MDNNPTESLTLDAAIEYLTELVIEMSTTQHTNAVVLGDLRLLKAIRIGYDWIVPQ